MHVKILFFGATADIVGERTLELTIAGELGAGEFLAEMVGRFPALGTHNLHLAVNQQYATGSEPVKDGDEIAVFTAVSGG